MPNIPNNRDKKNKKNLSHVPANATFPIANGKKDSHGNRIPTVESVIAAQKFIEENKK